MLKYIALAFVFAVSVFIGNELSKRLKFRAHYLGLLYGMLSEAAVQMKYLSPTVEQLVMDFYTCGRYTELDFLPKILTYAEESDIRSAWQRAVSETRLPLENSDIAVLQTVGGFLGTSDTDGQLSMLETQLSVLEEQRERASEIYDKKGRMYRSVSLLIGLGICIMLF